MTRPRYPVQERLKEPPQAYGKALPIPPQQFLFRLVLYPTFCSPELQAVLIRGQWRV
jgi:hypothetical protein